MADFTDGNTYLLGGVRVTRIWAYLRTMPLWIRSPLYGSWHFDPLELRAVRGMSSIAGQDSIWVNEFGVSICEKVSFDYRRNRYHCS